LFFGLLAMLRRKLGAADFVLLGLVSIAVARAGGEIDVQWYPTPKVDGSIGENEYPPPAASIQWSEASSCKVYVCQNASFLFIAVDVPDETSNANDRMRIWLGREPPSPERPFRTDDYCIIATRSGQWSLGKLAASNASKTDSSGWRVELAVSFSELGIAKGKKKAMAIVIDDDGDARARWPEGAEETSPSTWGTLYSSYSWGRIELVLQSIRLDAAAPIAGKNVTIYAYYDNEGTAPAENVTVGFYVDGSAILIFNDTRRLEAHGSLVANATWRAAFGNHTISARLDPFNRIFERDEANNYREVAVQARMARLKVKARQGVNVTAGGETKTVNASGEVEFDVSLGRLNLSTQSALYKGGTRHVFQRWSNGENESSIELLVSGDLELEAFYKTEYLVRFSFQDNGGRQVSPKPSSVTLTAPNGSTVSLYGTYDVWMQEGTAVVSSIMWQGINVKPEGTVYRVQGPADLQVRCRIYDVEVRVKDGFDFPVQGANVTLLLPNQTRVWRLTDGEGRAEFAWIPVGRVEGSVSNLGMATPIEGIDLVTDYAVTVSIPLSANSILVLAAACVGVASTILVIWMKRGARKQKVPEPLRHLGPPV
ncbi:MAG: hypothetical protein JTT11_09640, partial [Candidatus Brockarchaeota archaeon]|nr:hypothetical protein [Candidatus Brockarchaeota archaeon]